MHLLSESFLLLRRQQISQNFQMGIKIEAKFHANRMKGAWLAYLKNLVFCKILLLIGFLASLAIVCVIELFLHVTVRPWNIRLYRKMDGFLVSNFGYTPILFILLWWSNFKMEMTADPFVIKNHLGKEHAIMLLNHKCDFDSFLMLLVADHFGMCGNYRVFTKKSVQYIPFLGWAMKLHEFIFLERDWQKDKKKFQMQLRDLILHSDPEMNLLFAEGTRYSPMKHEASMKVAKEKGLPELKHVLLPRTRGFTECIKILKGSQINGENVAVYDATMIVLPSGKNQAISNYLDILGGKGAHVKVFLKRYSVQEIPEDEEKCAAWLHGKFQEKDQLLENVSKNGNFIDDNNESSRPFEKFQTIRIKRRLYILVNYIVSSVITLGPIFWLIANSALNMCLVQSAAISGGLIALGNLGLQYFSKVGQIETASSYGLTKQQEEREKTK